MSAISLLHSHLNEYCPEIHNKRLQSVIDVATSLQSSRSMSLTAMGRNLESESSIKHRVKKVDRLVGNKNLYNELTNLYSGLSDYVFKYLCHTKEVPIIIDLCYMKDTHDIQMLSAEVATKGRSIPIYRDIFEINKFKSKSEEFINNLSKIVPNNRDVLIIMDAGFGDNWLEEIEKAGWFWLLRARNKKYIKLSENHDWANAASLFDKVLEKAKNYPEALINKASHRPCRVITKKFSNNVTKRKRPKRLPRNYNSSNGNYKRSANEPWILVTNLPSRFNTTKVISAYAKRMQIEESFRDLKSHQFGLGARYIQTRNIYRWAIKMLLAAIVQITLWIIGVIGHSQGFQRKFQTNTVENKKIFSYFFLGQLIIEHSMLNELCIDKNTLSQTISKELSREW